MKFLNTTVTNKTNSFFACKSFSNAFVSDFLDVSLVFAVYDGWKCDRRRWWFFRNFIEDFLTLVKKDYIISGIISSNMNYEIVWFFLDYAIQFLQNLFICTPWKVHNFYIVVNSKTFLRDTIYYGVSGQYDFLFRTQRFCLSFFFSFRIRTRTGVSSFSF